MYDNNNISLLNKDLKVVQNKKSYHQIKLRFPQLQLITASTSDCHILLISQHLQATNFCIESADRDQQHIVIWLGVRRADRCTSCSVLDSRSEFVLLLADLL